MSNNVKKCLIFLKKIIIRKLVVGCVCYILNLKTTYVAFIYDWNDPCVPTRSVITVTET